MTLVADSGSTKTTWAVAGTGSKMVTEGLNPHFTTDEAFRAAFSSVRRHFAASAPALAPLHFYGAGCGDEGQRLRVQRLLRECFGTDDVHVDTDMLGACRAVCGDGEGLVGILGTGSNACLYDGRHITRQAVSTGYILGDHGSANHVGRVLLNGYLTRHMPEGLRATFHDAYGMSEAELMDAVYHQPHPNRFLASLAPFALQHLGDDYCRRVVTLTLEEWFTDAVMPILREATDGVALHVVGGYAKAVETTLRAVMEQDGVTVGTVVADPMDGLLRYHAASVRRQS